MAPDGAAAFVHGTPGSSAKAWCWQNRLTNCSINETMRSDLMGSIFPLHLPPSLSLSGLPLPGFLWCGGQNGETTGTICQMCVSHTKLPLCHLGFFSTRNCLECVRALQYWNFLEKHSDKSSLIITKCPQTQTFEILLPATVSPTKA